MWVARDKDDTLYIYVVKPERAQDEGEWLSLAKDYSLHNSSFAYVRLNKTLFPEVTWDTEPKWVRFCKKMWVYESWRSGYYRLFLDDNDEK